MTDLTHSALVGCGGLKRHLIENVICVTEFALNEFIRNEALKNVEYILKRDCSAIQSLVFFFGGKIILLHGWLTQFFFNYFFGRKGF